MLRVIARNAASNWLGYAVQVVVTFFLTPFVLKSLGDTRYGIWALITGLTGYYGLLALGLQAGVTQLMTHSIAEKDYDKLNRIASAAVFALTVCSIFVILAATMWPSSRHLYSLSMRAKRPRCARVFSWLV